MANDIFTFVEEEKEYTIVMFSGLTNKIIKDIGGIQNLDMVVVDAEAQDKIVKTLLTSYDEQGKEKEIIFSPFRLSNQNRANLINWGYEHITDFLLETAQQTTKQNEKVKKILEALKAG